MSQNNNQLVKDWDLFQAALKSAAEQYLKDRKEKPSKGIFAFSGSKGIARAQVLLEQLEVISKQSYPEDQRNNLLKLTNTLFNHTSSSALSTYIYNKLISSGDAHFEPKLLPSGWPARFNIVHEVKITQKIISEPLNVKYLIQFIKSKKLEFFSSFQIDLFSTLKKLFKNETMDFGAEKNNSYKNFFESETLRKQAENGGLFLQRITQFFAPLKKQPTDNPPPVAHDQKSSRLCK